MQRLRPLVGFCLQANTQKESGIWPALAEHSPQSCGELDTAAAWRASTLVCVCGRTPCVRSCLDVGPIHCVHLAHQHQLPNCRCSKLACMNDLFVVPTQILHGPCSNKCILTPVPGEGGAAGEQAWWAGLAARLVIVGAHEKQTF